MARDEGAGVGVLPLAESVCLPGVRELVRVGTGVSVEGASVRVISGYVGVERGRRSIRRGGATLRSGLRRGGSRSCGLNLES